MYFSTPIALITNEIMVRYLPKIDFERKTTKLSCILDFKLANSKFVNENVSPRLQFLTFAILNIGLGSEVFSIISSRLEK